MLVGEYYADLWVEEQVIPELKAVGALNETHAAQLISYLNPPGMKHGILMSFGAPKFEIKKYIL